MKKFIAAALSCCVLLCGVLLACSQGLPGTTGSTPPGTTDIPTSIPGTSSAGTVSTAPSSSTSPTAPPTTVPVTIPSTAPTVPTTAPVPPPTTAPTAPSVPEPPVPPEPQIRAKYAFIYDPATAQMLYSKGDASDQVYPASLTKLFTIYVALQHLSLDQEVTVGEEITVISENSSTANLQVGNRLTVSMLVGGMMLCSGNDAAYALAAAAGYALEPDLEMDPHQAVARFVEEMNAQARLLELTGTHFCNPDGIHDDNHYTTPMELLTIATLAMELEPVRTYAAMAEYRCIFLSGEEHRWLNTNYLLKPNSPYYCADAIGLKTGYTGKAGACQITAFRKGESYVLVCIMRSYTFEQRAEDTLALYDAYIKESPVS